MGFNVTISTKMLSKYFANENSLYYHAYYLTAIPVISISPVECFLYIGQLKLKFNTYL